MGINTNIITQVGNPTISNNGIATNMSMTSGSNFDGFSYPTGGNNYDIYLKVYCETPPSNNTGFMVNSNSAGYPDGFYSVYFDPYGGCGCYYALEGGGTFSLSNSYVTYPNWFFIRLKWEDATLTGYLLPATEAMTLADAQASLGWSSGSKSYVGEIDANDKILIFSTASTFKIDLANSSINGDILFTQSNPTTTIKLRRDTTANWTSVNPILAEGEVGLITDQAQYVVGDGTSTFSSLTKHNMDTDISNLANTSLSNLTSSGKQLLSSASMPVPSATLTDDDIAVPASGSPITVSADGWLFIVLANASVGDYMQFNSTITGAGIEPNGLIAGSTATMTGQYLYLYMPMKEGQTAYLYYQMTGSAYVLVFRFIKTYMEGV